MLSKAEQSAALAEILDPQKIQVYCGLHQYFGPNTNAKKPPKFDCPRCWFVYFLVDIATTPPSHRAQRLDELESVIHHLVEAAEKGSFDFTPFARAKIEFSKEDDPKVTLTEGD